MKNNQKNFCLIFFTVLYCVIASTLTNGMHNIFRIIVALPISFLMTFLFPAFVWIISQTDKESYSFKYIVHELLGTLLLKRYTALLWIVVVLFIGGTIRVSIAQMVNIIIALIFIGRIYVIIKHKFDFNKVRFWIIMLVYTAFNIVIAI